MNVLIQATTLLLLSALLVLTPGCMTYDVRGTRAQQQREDTLLYEEDVRRLSGRLEGNEMELERLQMQLDQMEGDQRNFIDQRVRALEEDVASTARRMDTLEASRERDKQEIIDKLSAKMAEIMAARNVASSRSASPQGRRAIE